MCFFDHDDSFNAYVIKIKCCNQNSNLRSGILFSFLVYSTCMYIHTYERLGGKCGICGKLHIFRYIFNRWTHHDRRIISLETECKI